MDDIQEMISEFIVDCSENLEEFESNLLDLEKDPTASELLDSMFRMIHSIKGASGFLAFTNLESLTHKAENVLDLLRNAKGSVDQSLISTFLDVCDAMRTMFSVIEEQGNDGENNYDTLISQLLQFEDAFKSGDFAAMAEAQANIENHSVEETKEESPKPEAPASSGPILDENGEIDIDAMLAASKEEEESEPEELDPVQIETLKALGLYEEPKALAKVEEKKPSPVKAEEKKVEAPKKVETPKKASAPVQKKETIRVEVETLDRLVNLAGELVLVRNQLLELSKNNESQIFDGSFASLDMVTGEMQRTLMTTRMQPISTVWSKMPRIVRDLSSQLGRDIELQMHGEATELDKTIIESISDPMTHIIRNCCDHGIEQPEEREAQGKPRRGTIKLIAEHRGNWIHVDVIDDGKGISRDVLKRKAIEKELFTQEELNGMTDQQVLNIIFHPGFSTKDQASNISGRGVGMDVIKSNIQKINGKVELASTEGKGTCLKIRLPLTLAIIPAVIVSIDDARYAIPQNTVQEVAVANKEELEELENVGGQKFTRLRGQILPLVFASEFLKTKTENAEDSDSIYYVVINADGFRFGLVIDKVIDIIEIVVKPLDSDQDFRFYAGATIMGDGKVALILDTTKIGELSKINKNNLEDEAHQDFTSHHGPKDTSNLTLTFKLRDGKNYLIPLSKTSRIEEIEKSNIEERQLGTFAKFNNKIIRVVDLMSLIGIYPDSQFDWVEEQSSLKALYFEFNGTGIAIDVGFDHSLLHQTYDVEGSGSSEFVIGTALINDEVYEVISIEDYLGSIVGNTVNDSVNTAIEESIETNTALNLHLNSDETNSIVSFVLGDLWLGVELNSIREIIATEDVTTTPGSRDCVEGLLNLRGEIMVAKRLSKLLNASINSEDADSDNTRSLIIHEGDNKFCLQIGKVDEILSLNNNDFEPAPANIPANILTFLKGVYNINNSMLLVLDEKKLINDVVVKS